MTHSVLYEFKCPKGLETRICAVCDAYESCFKAAWKQAVKEAYQ